MFKEKFLSCTLALTIIFISIFSTATYAVENNSDLNGQLEIVLEENETSYEGSFIAHKDNARIILKTNNPNNTWVYINGQEVKIRPYLNKNANKYKSINVGPYVVEGENHIVLEKSGYDTKVEMIIPYLKLKTGRAEDVGMDSNTLKRIDNIVNENIKNEIIPGAVVLVAKNGVIVKNQAYGLQQKYDMGKLVEEPVETMTNTIYDLASVTKVMATTQAIMTLVSEGKLDVNDKVAKYIPEFASNGKENVTIADLLTHTSGLTPWLPSFYYAENRKEELDFINKLPLEYETGSKRVYSDFSFMTLGAVVEKITGQGLDEYLDKNVYKKLNMKDTYFNPPEDLNYRIAATSWGNPYEYKMVDEPDFGYNVDEKVEDFKKWRNYTLIGEVNDGNAFYANEGIAGHAGLFSTAKDLAVLGQTMLNGGGYGTTRIYKSSVIEEFIKPQRFGQGYGFELDKSWYMGKLYSDKAFGHTGFTGTQIIFDPEYDLQIIILTNKQNVGQKPDGNYHSTGPLSRAICDIVYQSIGY